MGMLGDFYRFFLCCLIFVIFLFSSSYAHAKGVVAADEKSGFWFIHSKPHWPNAVEDGPAVLPDVTYAQSFMCLSLELDELNSVGDNLMLNYPKIYDSSFPSSFSSFLPTLEKWIDGGKDEDLSVSLTNSFKTIDVFYNFFFDFVLLC